MNAARHILIHAVQLYRWSLSPAKQLVFGPLARCRFSPTCSEYAIDAIRKHGAWRGTWIALKRIARCHPWGGCGLDPVPAGNEVTKQKTEPRQTKRRALTV